MNWVAFLTPEQRLTEDALWADFFRLTIPSRNPADVSVDYAKLMQGWENTIRCFQRDWHDAQMSGDDERRAWLAVEHPRLLASLRDLCDALTAWHSVSNNQQFVWEHRTSLMAGGRGYTSAYLRHVLENGRADKNYQPANRMMNRMETERVTENLSKTANIPLSVAAAVTRTAAAVGGLRTLDMAVMGLSMNRRSRNR
jgi:hypothetical protein